MPSHSRVESLSGGLGGIRARCVCMGLFLLLAGTGPITHARTASPRPYGARMTYGDPAKHTAQVVEVAPSVSLEVLDYGGRGGPAPRDGVAGGRESVHARPSHRSEAPCDTLTRFSLAPLGGPALSRADWFSGRASSWRALNVGAIRGSAAEAFVHLCPRIPHASVARRARALHRTISRT